MDTADRVTQLPNSTQSAASIAPILEVDCFGKKHRIWPKGYSWIDVHIKDIDSINNID